MQDTPPRFPGRLGRVHAALVPVPILCFAATLVTDIVYWQSAAMMWANMSAWLLLVGLIAAFFAVIAGTIEFLAEPRLRQWRIAWVHVLGNVLALALSIVNAMVHTRDAYTSVVPSGLILSGIVVALIAVTAWAGGSLARRHALPVRERGAA